jgi:hypothetical protein
MVLRGTAFLKSHTLPPAINTHVFLRAAKLLACIPQQSKTVAEFEELTPKTP